MIIGLDREDDYIKCYVCGKRALKINGRQTQSCEERYKTGHCRGVHQPIVIENPKPGRNVPCGCGSGLKFKHCCMKREKVMDKIIEHANSQR